MKMFGLVRWTCWRWFPMASGLWVVALVQLTSPCPFWRQASRCPCRSPVESWRGMEILADERDPQKRIRREDQFPWDEKRRRIDVPPGESLSLRISFLMVRWRRCRGSRCPDVHSVPVGWRRWSPDDGSCLQLVPRRGFQRCPLEKSIPVEGLHLMVSWRETSSRSPLEGSPGSSSLTWRRQEEESCGWGVVRPRSPAHLKILHLHFPFLYPFSSMQSNGALLTSMAETLFLRIQTQPPKMAPSPNDRFWLYDTWMISYRFYETAQLSFYFNYF